MTPDRRQALALLFAALAAAACTHTDKGTPPMTDIPTGQPGQFDFLQGEWKITHRRLPSPGAQWDTFEGEASCWTILSGAGSVEELRIPARDFSGMGLRLLDQDKKVWNDLWVNAKSGVLLGPGTSGGFASGAGIFDAAETVDGKTFIYRGVWDEITPTSCRWRQMASDDGGATWTENWLMHWTRVAALPVRQPVSG
ncbi:hypothetical protein [Hyphomonas sp.]|uniref:hypothetical protein n=1 Tax=Hyphomonas sp. TaxID=87 RepID=UPI0025BBD6E1|nr:hypothetical protein [Hyphomonas sp.]